MTSGLRIEGLAKRFGDIQALRNCSLTVERGHLVGFLGPNGAGKTTTMRSVLGLIEADAGSMTWDGAPVDGALRSRTGYMPQERGLYVRMRVREHVSYIGQLAGMPQAEADRSADHWIERVGLAERSGDPIQELSVGNQQRVQLAVALVHSPELLVLDEPFAGLDPVAVATLSEVMTEQVEAGAAVVFSSHQLDLVQDLCRDVTIVAAGQTVASGDVDELRASSDWRILEVAWRDAAPSWHPPECTAVEDRNGRVRYTLPATVDGNAVITAASAAAEITAVSFEPPGLEDVFVELVGTSESAAGSSR